MNRNLLRIFIMRLGTGKLGLRGAVGDVLPGAIGRTRMGPWTKSLVWTALDAPGQRFFSPRA